MTELRGDVTGTSGRPADEESLVGLISRVVSDAEQVARAEIELQKARALAKVDEAKSAVVLLVLALVAGSSALTALVVGALMILTPRVGPVWATVIVAGVLIGASALCASLALRHLKRVFGAGGGTK